MDKVGGVRMEENLFLLGVFFIGISVGICIGGLNERSRIDV